MLGRAEPTRTLTLERWGTLFVWGVWALTLVTAVALVVTYGANIPVWDDWWGFVNHLVSGKPISVAWLWSSHDGASPHHYVLTRLLVVSLYRITGDLRGAMIFDVLILGLLAFSLILRTRQLRGRSSYADAFLPLALLHLGHTTNFLWSWQLAYILPVFLIGVCLMLILSANSGPRPKPLILLGVCLLLLPLCGAIGVIVLPALALWLIYMGVLHWRAGGSPRARRDSLLILALGATALLWLRLYWIGLPHSDLPKSNLTAILRAILQFVALGTFGPTISSWPRALRAAGQLTAVFLFLVSIPPLLITILRSRPERPRALGLLAFQGAMGCVVGTIGIVRAGYAGWSYYVTLFAPALCSTYLIWVLYGPPVIGRLMTAALFASQVAVALPNFGFGISVAKYHHEKMVALERDLRAGVPTYVFLGRYSRLLNADRTELLNAKRSGFGSFASLQEDPAFREIRLPLEPAAVHDITWDRGIARPIGGDPYVVFALPEERFVGGVRLKYSHEGRPDGTPEPIRTSWKKGGQDRFNGLQTRLNRFHCLGPGDETLTTWIGGTIQQIRIRLDITKGAYEMRISELVLLVPDPEDDSTRLAKDTEVEVWPKGRRFEPRSNELFLNPFEEMWPIDRFHSLPVFVRDICEHLFTNRRS